jgi:hypothetical protein
MFGVGSIATNQKPKIRTAPTEQVVHKERPPNGIIQDLPTNVQFLISVFLF